MPFPADGEAKHGIELAFELLPTSSARGIISGDWMPIYENVAHKRSVESEAGKCEARK
jgi:hypothetical protein